MTASKHCWCIYQVAMQLPTTLIYYIFQRLKVIMKKCQEDGLRPYNALVKDVQKTKTQLSAKDSISEQIFLVSAKILYTFRDINCFWKKCSLHAKNSKSLYLSDLQIFSKIQKIPKDKPTIFFPHMLHFTIQFCEIYLNFYLFSENFKMERMAALLLHINILLFLCIMCLYVVCYTLLFWLQLVETWLPSWKSHDVSTWGQIANTW